MSVYMQNKCVHVIGVATACNHMNLSSFAQDNAVLNCMAPSNTGVHSLMLFEAASPQQHYSSPIVSQEMAISSVAYCVTIGADTVAMINCSFRAINFLEITVHHVCRLHKRKTISEANHRTTAQILASDDYI